MLNGPFVSFVISVSHITLDTHTVLVWTDLYAHTHLTTKADKTHSLNHTWRQGIQGSDSRHFLEIWADSPKKLMSRTRWILIRLFKNWTKMLKPRLRLGYSHWWKCTICILANIWHIFIDEHNICSDCQLPVADAEDQAQLCKHFGHFKYLVFYLLIPPGSPKIILQCQQAQRNSKSHSELVLQLVEFWNIFDAPLGPDVNIV